MKIFSTKIKKAVLFFVIICSFSFLAAEDEKEEKTSGNELTSMSHVKLAMSNPLYPVTAGDVYTLAFAAGANAVTYSIPVDSTYKIRIANLGVIDCKGLTYLELKNQVTSIVQKNYPMGGLQFILSSPAAFTVTVNGEVSAAAERTAGALTRLSHVVGPLFTAYSSNRNIKIISEDGKEKTCDLY